MNRQTGNDRKTPKPVEKIELDESKVKLRTIFFVVAIAVALGAFGFGIYSFLHRPAGWTEIKVEGGETNSSFDLTFYYNVGSGENDSDSEYRALTALYGNLCLNAYRIFDEYAKVEGVRNLNYVNRHPNEIVEVDEVLFSALKYMTENCGRYIYSFPAYSYTGQIFFMGDETERSEYDYKANENAREYISELSAFYRSDAEISVEFLEGNRIKLFVSQNYLQVLSEYGVEEIIGFGFFKNAFIVDYVADELIKRGFVYGILNSFDGYSRTLGKSEQRYAFGVYDFSDDGIIKIGEGEYFDSRSVVYFRDFPLNEKDLQRMRVYSDGRIAHDRIDENGFYKNASDFFIGFSNEKSCVEIAVAIAKVYVSDVFSESKLDSLKNGGVGYAYLSDKTLNVHGDGINFAVSEGYEISR